MNDVTRLELPLIGPDEWDTTFPFNEPARHWDRRGNPITFREWATLFEHVDKNGQRYQIVKQEHVGDYFVSTVWLGLDHGFSLDPAAPPIIFETMIFNHGPEHAPRYPSLEEPNDDWAEQYQRRYATEEQALAGHADAVEQVRLINEAFS